jgi:FixJ family two-component response regulator
VILSGHGDVRDAALALGAVDYLRKPLRADSLLEIAERYCRPSSSIESGPSTGPDLRDGTRRAKLAGSPRAN